MANIEMAVQSIGSQNATSNQLNVAEFIYYLWSKKLIIIVVCAFFLCSSVIYALSLPNVYLSEGIYTSAQKQAGGSINAQYGDLASLAGINLGGIENNDMDQALTLITSWPFLESVIEKHNLKPYVMAVVGWNVETGALKWDVEKYDPDNKVWLVDDQEESVEPSSYDSFEKFRNMIEISNDKKAGLITVSVEYFSPELASKWLNILIAELNNHFQSRDVVEARKNVEYLRAKITETSIAEMQSVFYGMIEKQMKTLMLAEVSDEYILKSVVPVKIPEKKSGPSRSLIVLITVIFSGMFVCIVFLIRFILRRN